MFILVAPCTLIVATRLRTLHSQNSSNEYRVEDRLDRRENIIDRREDRRDRAVNNGPLDRLEDRVARLENIQDRREDRRDRLNLY